MSVTPRRTFHPDPRIACAPPALPLPLYLVDLQVWIRADDRAPAEVHALARQVAPEPALLALEPLNKPSEGEGERGEERQGWLMLPLRAATASNPDLPTWRDYPPLPPQTPEGPAWLLILQGESWQVRVDEHRHLDLRRGRGGGRGREVRMSIATWT